jgi:hypothetical protein
MLTTKKSPISTAPLATTQSWVDIFRDNLVLTRFLVAFIVVLVAAGLVVYEVFNRLRPAVAVDPTTGTVTIVGFGLDHSTILLPASQLWIDTGIDVSAKQKLQLSCSGSVHLAVHRLVEAAQNRAKPMHHIWGGPEGHVANAEDRPIDILRRKMLVDPNAPIGAVLAFIKGPSDSPPGDRDPRPHGIQTVGKVSFVEGQGRLYLTVNDLLFEDTDANRAAYVGTKAIVESSYGKGTNSVEKLTGEWEAIKKNQRTLAFYDDNVGDFMVQVIVYPK